MLTSMILAAGFGSRLRPLTDELPKPLVPIGDRCALAFAADNLRALGVERVVINTHHLARCYDRDALSHDLGLDVTLNFEPTLCGTAGGIRGAADALGAGAVAVHNGDILADLDMAQLGARHTETRALATLAVRAGLPANRGPVGLGPDGRIVRLRDRRFAAPDAELGGAEFVGVHVLSDELRRELPTAGCMVGDVYIPALERGRAVEAAPVVRSYTDVGTLAAYLAANRRWLADHQHASFRGAGATVAAGVELVDTVLGAGAQVIGAGTLEGCVVWPGAIVEAPLAHAVVTAGGRVAQQTAPSVE